jgi:GT2 family glycosyltransferase
MNIRVAVCIVFYDDLKHVERLVLSLKNLNYKNLKFFFTDNSQDNKHVELFQNSLPEAIFIKSEQNQGFAGGNNLLVREAKKLFCEAFFILNPDMAPEPDCLAKMTEIMASDNRIYAVGPVICHGYTEKDPVIQLAGVQQNFITQKKTHLYSGIKLNDIRNNKPFFTDSLNGGALLIKTDDLIDKDFLFEEKYFMYNDETDLFYRAKINNKLAAVVPSAVIFHYHDWSKKNNTGYHRMYYYMMRNKFLFWKKYKMRAPFLKGLLKEIFLFPVIFSFCYRTAGLRMIYFYYLGVLHGIKNISGRINLDFK